MAVLRAVDHKRNEGNKASQTWYGIKAKYSALDDVTTAMLVSARHTPAASPDVLVEIAYVYLKRKPADDRRRALVKLCKSLSVKNTLIDTLKQKYNKNRKEKSSSSKSIPKSADRPVDDEHVAKKQRKVVEEHVEEEDESVRRRIPISTATGSSGGGSRAKPRRGSRKGYFDLEPVPEPKDSRGGGNKVLKKQHLKLRIDEETKLGSLKDVIIQVRGRVLQESVESYLARYPALRGFYQLLDCNDRGTKIQVAPVGTLIRAALVVEEGVTKEHRMYVAKQICDTYGEPHSLIIKVQKSPTKATPASSANQELSETRAANEKRASTPTPDADPPAKRAMRESTRICTIASSNACGTEVRTTSSNMDIVDVDNTHTRNSEHATSAGIESSGASRSSAAAPEVERTRVGATNVHATVTTGANSNVASTNSSHTGSNGGGGSSSGPMDVVVHDNASSSGSCKSLAANDASLTYLLAQLGEVAQSNASDHARKLLEAAIVAKYR